MSGKHVEQEWANGCASCCSPFSTCLLSWCIPCITYGRIHHRLHKDANLKGFSMFNLDCLGYCALSCCTLHWIIQMMQRGEIRQKYGLKGNGCTDCLMACCCTPCDLTQQDKEVKTREGEKTALISQQPVAHEGMHYGGPQHVPTPPASDVKQEYQPAQPSPQYHAAPQYAAPHQNGTPQYTHAQPYGA